MGFVTWPVAQPKPPSAPSGRAIVPPPPGAPPYIPYRQLGAVIVTTQTIVRTAGIAHGRAAGTPITLGRALAPQALNHARAQGGPQLSAHVNQPAGLAHARAQGAPEVSQPILQILALDRG